MDFSLFDKAGGNPSAEVRRNTKESGIENHSISHRCGISHTIRTLIGIKAAATHTYTHIHPTHNTHTSHQPTSTSHHIHTQTQNPSHNLLSSHNNRVKQPHHNALYLYHFHCHGAVDTDDVRCGQPQPTGVRPMRTQSAMDADILEHSMGK